MTDKQPTIRTPQPFELSLFDSLLKAWSKDAGKQWKVVEGTESEPNSDDAESIFINLELDGSLNGQIQWELRHSDAMLLASSFLREPANEFGQEQSDAILRAFEAGVSDFKSVSAEKYGAFAVKVGIVPEALPDRESVSCLNAADDEGKKISLSTYISATLSENLTLLADSMSSAAGTAGKGLSSTEKNNRTIDEQMNLKLVMDVELNVTLRFGQRQLTLREVLDLTSGSVVELDRQVEEPVELLLDGRIIARGEAVVIDGNYGLRVTELPHPLSLPLRR